MLITTKIIISTLITMLIVIPFYAVSYRRGNITMKELLSHLVTALVITLIVASIIFYFFTFGVTKIQ